jgi:hypothetical protein
MKEIDQVLRSKELELSQVEIEQFHCRAHV